MRGGFTATVSTSVEPFPPHVSPFLLEAADFRLKLLSCKFSQVEVVAKSCQPHPDRTEGESGFPWDSGNLL